MRWLDCENEKSSRNQTQAGKIWFWLLLQRAGSQSLLLNRATSALKLRYGFQQKQSSHA